VNMKGLYNLTAGDQIRVSLPQKMLFASLMVALIVASFSVTGVLAANNAAGPDDLQQAWNDKVAKVRAEAAFLNNVRLLPSMFPQQALGPAIPVTGDQAQNQTATLNRNKWSDWQKAQFYLDKYRAAMSQAQTIIFQHNGFDFNGQVLNQKQANRSFRDLADQLRIMRNMRLKIQELGLGNLFLQNNNNTNITTTP
jgi:hypothetical protein